MFGELAVGILGSAAGGKVGEMMGGKEDKWQLSDTMNGILQRALEQSIQSYAFNNQQAVAALQQGTSQSNAVLQAYMKQIQQNSFTGMNQYRALTAPYRNAGFNALDRFQMNLRMPTPAGGSAAQADARYKQTAASQLDQMFGGKAPTDPGNIQAPNYSQLTSQITPQQIYDYQVANSKWVDGKQIYTGAGAGQIGHDQMTHNAPPLLKFVIGNPNTAQYAQQALANGLFTQAQAQYQQQQQQQQQYQQYQSLFNQIQ